MATNVNLDPAAFDPALLIAVQRMIPAERLKTYVHDLDLELATLLGCADDDATLEGRAHRIVSQGGMLGLTRLAQRARHLEDACRAGAPPRAALVQLRAAAGDIRRYAMPAGVVPAS